ncbi:MAG: hypothetical protein MK207_08295 [Saprospiraceae bacterium]|nr:hypothetical protein [Saprospiraceae bacterium]
MRSLRIQIIFVILSLVIFTRCGNDETINYRDKIIGAWELKNVGELQSLYRNNSFILKNATMVLDDNGTIETRMLSSKDKTTWITQTGTWSMPTTGGYLTIKADNGPFDDVLNIQFTDERTFYIMLNGMEYQFVKI